VKWAVRRSPRRRRSRCFAAAWSSWGGFLRASRYLRRAGGREQFLEAACCALGLLGFGVCPAAVAEAGEVDCPAYSAVHCLGCVLDLLRGGWPGVSGCHALRPLRDRRAARGPPWVTGSAVATS
jgi:hypothetical protein